MNQVRLLNIFADIFTNLAAGWFGAAILAPGFTSLNEPRAIITLFLNLLSGILAIAIAYNLQSKIHELS